MDNKSAENRAARFKRVGERRTQAIINALRILGNCSNKSFYQYSDDEVSKIFRAIDEQLRLTKSKFRTTKIKFKLDS